MNTKMNLFLITLCLCATLSLQQANAQICGQTPATLSVTNSTASAIPDAPGPPVTSTILIGGAGAFLANVTLSTSITHTFNGDLDITLTSPAGTVVTLTTDNGGSNDDVFNGTLWDDDANDPVTDHTFTNLVVATPLSPEEPLAAFYGENPNGIWTLTIADDTGADIGNLNSWTLNIFSLPAPVAVIPPISFANSTATAIPDAPNPPVSSTILVSGLGSNLTGLTLSTFITHTFNGDLDITLTSPAGTVVTVSTDNGGNNDDVFNGTLFDDDANDPVTDHIYANLVVATPLSPEEPFAAFKGENPNGIWTLTIADDAGADTGTLNSWALSIATCILPSDYEICTQTPNLNSITNGTVSAIPDAPNPPLTSTILISGAGAFLTNVTLSTFITHTFNGDLDITLTSPAGTVVTLTTDNGSNNDNVFNGTYWNDDANDPVTDHTFTNLVVATPLSPEEPLSAFYGENPNGIWTLTIADDAGADTGTLNSWALNIFSTPAPVAFMPPIAFTNSTATAIPDAPNPPLTSTILVSGLGNNLTGLTLTTFITHTFNGDLDITLTSPAGTVVTVSTDNGGSNDNVFNGTLFDDDANDPVTDHAFANLVVATPLSPEEPFAAFKGENPNGIWTLTIADDAGADTGTLNSWSLSIATCLENDDCANATPLNCNDVVTGSTLMATLDGPAVSCNGGSVAPDVWYTVTGTGANITASLCTGTTYDSKLDVYTGTCGALTSVVCDDDFCAFAGPSEATWASTAGTTYFIRVHGFGGLTGNFTLSITAPPANDDCANAIPIACGDVASGSTTCATLDGPATDCLGGSVAADVWYTVIGTGVNITASLCAGTTYDSKIDVYTGACGALTSVVCDDDFCFFAGPSEVTWASTAGTTYLIRVHGFAGLTGNYTLSVTAPPPVNDACANAIPIACGDVLSGSTTCATLDGPAASCTGGSVAPDVWYAFTGNGFTATASLCSLAGYDTKLDIYSGACGALTAIACNDDFCGLQSEVSWTTTAGTVYLIRVHGFAGSTGDFALSVTAPPTNDNCANAIAAAPNVVIPFTNVCATTDGPNEPGLCSAFGDTNVQSDIWYTYFNVHSGDVTASLCGSGYDTKMAVYEGPACPAVASAIACNDDFCGLQSQVTFNAKCNTLYYIRIGGYLGAQGNGQLLITPPPPYTVSAVLNSGASCSGAANGSATAIVSGGTPIFTFLWDNGETTATASSLTAGIHVVSVTDANGCVRTTSINIPQPSAINCNVTKTNVSCFGAADGTATVSATGGIAPYTFLWSTGATTATITGLAAGGYSVTVTDSNGCQCVKSVTITQPAELQIIAGGEVNDDEGDIGTLPSYLNIHTIVVAGGSSPYSFNWSASGGYAVYNINYGLVDTDGNGTPDTQGATINIVYADGVIWSMIIDDAHNCGGGDLFTVSNDTPNQILDIDSYTIGSDNGSASGSINLVVTGGTSCPGYTFQWEGPGSWCCAATATTANVSGLPYGWYVVTITDCSSPTPQTTVGWFWVPKQTRGRGKIADSDLMTAYPNPAGAETTLEFSPMKTGNAAINLYSLSGQQVAQLFNGPAQSGELYTLPVSVAHLPAGTYLIVLQTDAGEQQQLKLSVVH